MWPRRWRLVIALGFAPIAHPSLPVPAAPVPEELGLAPAGEDGTYFQAVKMVGLTAQQEASKLAFRVKDFQITGKFGDDFVHSMDHVEGAPPSCLLESLDLVFVGHGVHSPAGLGWDDFKGESVAGKVLLVLISQPPVEPFPKEDMTYYGRWTYKFEEARRRGAAGCLILHFSDEFAGYPWSVTRTGYSGEKVALAGSGAGGASHPLALHGWLTRVMGEKLAEAAGTSLDAWVASAQRPDFRPSKVGCVSHGAEYAVRFFQGRNVLGALPGLSEKHRHEAVVIAGHHDHLGEREGEIYNGAVDNCTGVAMMLATARLLLESGETLDDRSVIFMAPTAEECGLLGSEFYAKAPTPIEPNGPKPQFLAAFAFDVGNVWGKTRDLSVLGFGKSTLDPILQEAAASLEMRIIPDQQPKMGLFYRSDHWSFVRCGVPGCWFFFGKEFVDKPPGYFEQVVGKYIQSEYHKPADTYRPEWTMEGLKSQVDYTVEVVRLLSRRLALYPKLLPESAQIQPPPPVPDMPDGQSWRRRPKKSLGFGLRCFDCKVEGCACFL
ncbi:unnamed protein product [Effrenium voratum]|nr:unnamed protein product [Effrenium voratum]